MSQYLGAGDKRNNPRFGKRGLFSGFLIASRSVHALHLYNKGRAFVMTLLKGTMRHGLYNNVYRSEQIGGRSMSTVAMSSVFQSSSTQGIDRLVMLTIADTAASDQPIDWSDTATISEKANIQLSGLPDIIDGLIEVGELRISEGKLWVACVPPPKAITQPDNQLSITRARQLRAEIGNSRGWTCSYCSAALAEAPDGKTLKATLDHVVPRSTGGSHDLSNLVLACGPCNSRKGDRS
jgi:hypothetical protein